MKILLLGSLYFLVSLSGCTQHDSHRHVDSKPKSINQQKPNPLYTCPMHPSVVQKEFGRCPLCGMDLVAAESESNTDDSANPLKDHQSIKLSQARQQSIGVKTQKVKKKKLFNSVRAPGRVAFDPELYTAQREYQEALRQLARVKESPLPSVKKNVSQMVSSAKIRLRVLGLSETEIRAINAKSTLTENLLISQERGNIWIYAEVFEMDLRNIKKGQSAKITSNFLDGKTLFGTVTSTDDVINPKTRTAKVRIRVKNPGVRLRPESFVDVTVLVPQGEHLSVPEDAIIDTGEESLVFVKKNDGVFEPRQIQILFRAQDEVAIASGIEPGENIVVSANFLIDSESRLKAALRKGGAQHKH